MCAEWREWELPKLSKVSSCYASSFSGTTTAEPDEVRAVFERKGFVRGHDLDGAMTTRDPWTTLTKSDEPTSFRMSFAHGDFVLNKRNATRTGASETVSVEEWQAMVALPRDGAAYAAKVRALDLPAVFDAGANARATCTDEELDVREPLLGERTVPGLVDVDVLATAKPETRRGVPPGFSPVPESELEKMSRGDARAARRTLDEILKRRLVPAFRVTRYKEPSRGTRAADVFFESGSVELAVAVIDLQERRVLCRATGKAENSAHVKRAVLATPGSSALEGRAVGDAEALDLMENVTAAARRALSSMNAKLAWKPAPVQARR